MTKASMIRIYSLILAIVMAQAFGQSVCHCQIMEHRPCQHGVEINLHKGNCDFYCGHRCLPSTDEKHHHCDCQHSLTVFMASRVNVDRDGPSIACDVHGTAGFCLHAPDHTCEVPPKPVVSPARCDTARAQLGRWLL